MKLYNLINAMSDGDLYYGYCEEEDLFIGWDKHTSEEEREYYLVNESVEIIKTLTDIKINFIY